MSRLAHQVAELTGFRDRDRLDVTLVGALRELLQPTSVTVWGCLGEGDERRWLNRARIERGDVAARSDPMWVEPDTLPRAADFPDRLRCLTGQSPVAVAGPSRTTSLFPLASDEGPGAVLELETEQPLDAAARRSIGILVKVYHNVQSLLDYSERDTLTGLLNRKTFDDSFLKLCVGPTEPTGTPDSRRRSVGGDYYLGVIDIDHFKSVNDRFGHLIGDEVLLLLSRLMRNTFRFSDRLYRFGGEEFVVTMRCASESDAMLAFERMRHNTERFRFPQAGTITVSVGFTAVRGEDTPDACFERADRAVYYAKGSGRNRVCSYAELVRAGALADADAKTGDVELF